MNSKATESKVLDSTYRQLAQELQIDSKQVAAIAQLLSDGSTVPFIARYRKEATGSCDEVIITAVRDEHHSCCG